MKEKRRCAETDASNPCALFFCFCSVQYVLFLLRLSVFICVFVAVCLVWAWVEWQMEMNRFGCTIVAIFINFMNVVLWSVKRIVVDWRERRSRWQGTADGGYTMDGLQCASYILCVGCSFRGIVRHSAFNWTARLNSADASNSVCGLHSRAHIVSRTYKYTYTYSRAHGSAQVSHFVNIASDKNSGSLHTHIQICVLYYVYICARTHTHRQGHHPFGLFVRRQNKRFTPATQTERLPLCPCVFYSPSLAQPMSGSATDNGNSLNYHHTRTATSPPSNRITYTTTSS